MSDWLEDLLRQGIAAVNIGVPELGESLARQGLAVVQVDWTPPAGGDPELIALLDQLL